MRSERMRAQASVLAQPCAQPADFADQVADIEAMLDGTYAVDGHQLRAVPGEHAQLTPWIFGSTKGQSAEVARRPRASVRRQLPHHPRHRARRDHRVPQRLPPLRPAGAAVRGGVGRRRGRRGQRHRALPRVQLRPLGVFHS
ncbi:hypothetical protein I548_4939 [Mycobacterium intracellulare]|nr:hypothetical protein I548_4939 [Mycobacterium intracellulare]